MAEIPEWRKRIQELQGRNDTAQTKVIPATGKSKPELPDDSSSGDDDPAEDVVAK